MFQLGWSVLGLYRKTGCSLPELHKSDVNGPVWKHLQGLESEGVKDAF